ncbi:hypothetical protein SLEP1_g40678 [Rubroshorea leprosula]|uniref:Uncharacterized protein n=1 Tax=Rubroshorea leprosula TaxID=152421 RepID=A0AAV5L4B7_9ROSI|nr:hypothetical protein SLEP1_g40678 [Rubroshorea leprosula]
MRNLLLRPRLCLSCSLNSLIYRPGWKKFCCACRLTMRPRLRLSRSLISLICRPAGWRKSFRA